MAAPGDSLESWFPAPGIPVSREHRDLLVRLRTGKPLTPQEEQDIADTARSSACGHGHLPAYRAGRMLCPEPGCELDIKADAEEAYTTVRRFLEERGPNRAVEHLARQREALVVYLQAVAAGNRPHSLNTFAAGG